MSAPVSSGHPLHAPAPTYGDPPVRVASSLKMAATALKMAATALKMAAMALKMAATGST